MRNKKTELIGNAIITVIAVVVILGIIALLLVSYGVLFEAIIFERPPS